LSRFFCFKGNLITNTPFSKSWEPLFDK
jgi:hypothetical protein